jgi:hypothetical protein
MSSKNRQETCKGAIWMTFFILYQECYLEKLKTLEEGLKWTHSSMFFIINFCTCHQHMGLPILHPHEHKGLWKMSKIGGPFPCSPQKDYFFPFWSPIKFFFVWSSPLKWTCITIDLSMYLLWKKLKPIYWRN